MILTKAVVECARGLIGEAREKALATGLYKDVIVDEPEKSKAKEQRQPGEDG